MRSVYECRRLLGKAIADGIIESAKEKQMDWAIAAIGRYVMLTFTNGDTIIHGPDIQTALNRATDYVLSLYPKEKTMTFEDAVLNGGGIDFSEHRGLLVLIGDDKDTIVMAKQVFTGYMDSCAIPYFVQGDNRQVQVECSNSYHDSVYEANQRKAWCIYLPWEVTPGGRVDSTINKLSALADYASVVIAIHGKYPDVTVEYIKNRWGKLGQIKTNEDIQEETKTMTTDDAKAKSKEFQFSYAECFRILREAEGNRIIRWWNYMSSSNNVDAQVTVHGGSGARPFDDDGTKGDIGILNEAARYVISMTPVPLGLRKDTRTMTAEECVKEIGDENYILKPDTYIGGGKDQVPCISLWTFPSDGMVYIMNPTETIAGFLRRCVEYVRSKKTT
jgi:hypothetical protein